MPKGYRHLTYDKRCQIYALLKSGWAKAEVARQIGVHRSTITKELKRNTGRKGYRYIQAQEKASARRVAASAAPRKMKPGLVREIEEKLTQEQWSPDQISGWLRTQGQACVSCERIYRHIWKDKRNGGGLWRCLRHSGKKYNKRKGKNSGRGLIRGRVDIAERPAIAAEKRRIGDWEGDTIIGRSPKGAIMTHVDRKSKYTKLAILPDKSAPPSKRPPTPHFFPSPTRLRPSLMTTARSSPATLRSQPSLALTSTSPSLIIPSGLNNTPTASSASTSQKAPTSLPSLPPIPNRTNSPSQNTRYKTPSEVFFAAA